MSESKILSLSNREIRAYARERLLGNMLIPCIVTFFFFSARHTFEMLMQLGVLGRDAFSFFFYIALFIVINTIWGLIRYGITRYYLSFVTLKKANPLNVFAGFMQSTEVIITSSLILSFISLILELPYLIYSFFFEVETINSLIIGLIILFVGNIIYYLIEAYLAPLYFVICDYPNMRLPMIIIMTLSLMNAKNFFKYIWLQISFIPLYLLGFLSLGIGLLWVVPYAYTSYAYFYENLCESYIQKQKESESTVEEENPEN